MIKPKATSTKMISREEKMGKISFFQKLADSSSGSRDFSKKIGACAIYAGLIDFSAIQSVRLLEQILLKSEISRGKKPSFKPHGDDFFYDKKLDTRRLIVEIKRFLPFKATGGTIKEEAEMINKLAYDMIDSINEFLDSRNELLHHIGSPRKSVKDIDEICNKVIKLYEKCTVANAKFILTAQPFGLSDEEMKHFKN